MQGREADFIIFDPVPSVANVLGDLGLAQDPKLMNVVHTRGLRGMATLYHEDVTAGTISETWKSKKDKTGRGVFEVFCLIPYWLCPSLTWKPDNPLPYLISILNYRSQERQVYKKEASNVKVAATLDKTKALSPKEDSMPRKEESPPQRKVLPHLRKVCLPQKEDSSPQKEVSAALKKGFVPEKDCEPNSSFAFQRRISDMISCTWSSY